MPGLEVCGAAYEGVGIPAVVASGRAAAGRVATPGGPFRSRVQNGRMTSQRSTTEINETIRYTMWSVFRLERRLRRRRPGQAEAAEVDALFDEAGVDVTSWCAAPTTSAACAPTPTS